VFIVSAIWEWPSVSMTTRGWTPFCEHQARACMSQIMEPRGLDHLDSSASQHPRQVDATERDRGHHRGRHAASQPVLVTGEVCGCARRTTRTIGLDARHRVGQDQRRVDRNDHRSAVFDQTDQDRVP
jgi:hypothetical protein